LLIFETPNPENLAVGTSTFYLDPTHTRPIPPPLLQFLTEQAGFSSSHVIRMNGEPFQASALSLERALRPMFTRSLDFAVVATNDTENDRLTELAALIEGIAQPHPVDLEAIHEASEEIGTAVRAAAGLSKRVGDLEESNELNLRILTNGLDLLRADLARVGKALERANANSAMAMEAQKAVSTMQSSWSWRLTRPLRILKSVVRRVLRAAPKGLASGWRTKGRLEESGAHEVHSLSGSPDSGAGRPATRSVAESLELRIGSFVRNLRARLRAKSTSISNNEVDDTDEVKQLMNRLPRRSRQLFRLLRDEMPQV
jgi:hypothetical protein